jgi:peptide/nickel transport system substrate-binding protein
VEKAARRWGAASSAVLAIAVAAGACEPRTSDRTTVLFASGADLQSINPLVAVHPLARQVQKYVLFLTLAAYDSALQPVPRLARWTWSADRTQLTFHLRGDVRWHDGVPITSRDVVWTLQHAQDPAVAFPRAGELRTLSAITAEDDSTVTLRFSAPQPVFPDVLTDLSILPAHRFEGLEGAAIRDAEFNRAPVGNGPFEFVEYRPNQRWVFRRHEGFPADLGVPAIDRFVVVVVDEPATKLAALTSGELDFAGISPAHVPFVRANPRLRVIDYPIFLSYAVVFNVRRAPFDDVRVRRALSRAIDRQALIDGALSGFGTPADGPVSPEHPWYLPGATPRVSPDEARAMLDSAGWRIDADGVRARGGRHLEFDLLTVGSGDLALEQMLEAQWRVIGVRIRIRRLELATFLSLAQGPERNFDALVTGIPGVMSLGHVAAMYDGDGPLAYPGYAAPDLTAAFAAVRRARSEPELVSAWQAVQRALRRGEPSAWLYHARGVQGVARRIEGVRIDLRGELAGVADWRIAPTAPPETSR